MGGGWELLTAQLYKVRHRWLRCAILAQEARKNRKLQITQARATRSPSLLLARQDFFAREDDGRLGAACQVPSHFLSPGFYFLPKWHTLDTGAFFPSIPLAVQGKGEEGGAKIEKNAKWKEVGW